MTTLARRALPTTRVVFIEQLRFTALTIRREALVTVSAMLVLLAVAAGGRPLDYSSELCLWFAGLGFVAPIAFARARANEGALSTLPVDHRRQLIIQIGAGWLWLMAAVAVLMLSIVALIQITGGNFQLQGTRTVLTSSMAISGSVDPARLSQIEWRTPVWLLVVPFTSATIAYLVSSALVAALQNSWRATVGVLLLGALLSSIPAGGHSIITPIVFAADGRYAVETALAGGPVLGKTAEVLLTDGQHTSVWLNLPDSGRWLTATLLWSAIAVAAVWLATIRLRERETGLADPVMNTRT